MVHHITDLTNHVAGHSHHARFLAVDQRHSQLRRRAKLRARRRQPGRPVEIRQRLADRRRQVPTVEVPLAGDLALDAGVHIDRELPAIRVLQTRGVLELNTHQVVGNRPGGGRIVAQCQLRAVSCDGLGSHLHTVEEQLHRGVIDGVRTISQQHANRRARRDTRDTRQRADFSHIRPAGARGIRGRIEGRDAIEAVRVVDRKNLAGGGVDRKEREIRPTTSLPIHDAERIQTIRHNIERKIVRVELVGLERQRDRPLIRSDGRRENAAGIDSTEHNVTIVIVHIRPVSGNRHSEGVSASRQLKESHRLHHKILRMISSTRDAGKELGVDSDDRKPGEVETHRRFDEAAVCQRPWSCLIRHQLI